MSGHRLGPHCVGRRVVVRRVIPGERGPSGGPAFTDVLGVMESWSGGTVTVRRESGEVVAVQVADIVSGKPVPPRPPVRLRVSVQAAEHRALEGWPAVETEPLGDWVMRAAEGFSARANSVLALGDPGLPLHGALDRVAAFYRQRALPAWAQVVVGSEEDLALAATGWVAARAGEADTVFQIAGMARALRAARDMLPSPAPVVSAAPSADPAWLADDERALAHPQAARRVLEGPGEVVFASVRPDAFPHGPLQAKGRAALSADGTWVGVTDVHVAPEHRRQGLAVVVLVELLGWAAERGATTAYLQVRGDNHAALALYERLGFLPHHHYRYLAWPAGTTPPGR